MNISMAKQGALIFSFVIFYLRMGSFKHFAESNRKNPESRLLSRAQFDVSVRACDLKYVNFHVRLGFGTDGGQLIFSDKIEHFTLPHHKQY